jgi:GT2 family glycosyltransferase
LAPAKLPIVYVDSGSSDGSATWARAKGFDVLELDVARPLSAARARNEGFDHIRSLNGDLQYVQFVDGDCEMHPEWIEHGLCAMSAHPGVGIVCGKVIERNPDTSVYNLLCSLEWQKQPGYISACGGIFMTRVEVFRSVGGFRNDVMAAEDDELCLRVRRAGWKILAVDEQMVLHDSAITRFSQWWTRARRAGMAYAQGAALHGSSPERHFVRECKSIWFWGLGVPAATLTLTGPTSGLSLFALLAYPALATKIYRAARKRGWSHNEAWIYAYFTVIGKYPALLGVMQFHYRTRWQKRAATLIEHKGPSNGSE